MRAVAPQVVAITGSFGKTSTKEHLRDILGAARTVVASPASFNNRAGLSRTILEHLVPGTQILIAEMGMYGPGEIADLCSWIQPEISVITAIAPVHLERVGSVDRIVEAKREILARARVAILNVDCAELAALAREIEPAQRVVRCGSVSDDADVVVRRAGDAFTIRTPAGVVEAVIGDPGVEPTNLRVARLQSRSRSASTSTRSGAVSPRCSRPRTGAPSRSPTPVLSSSTTRSARTWMAASGRSACSASPGAVAASW